MDELTSSTVIRAGQRPAMWLYVPLDLCLVEMVVFLILMRFIGFYSVIFAPIHMYYVIKTEADPYWIRAMWANKSHWFWQSNKGLKGKRSITFSPSVVKANKNDYADF